MTSCPLSCLLIGLLLPVVRSSYEDPFYSSLARKAIKDWKDTVTWSDSYHELSHGRSSEVHRY